MTARPTARRASWFRTQGVKIVRHASTLGYGASLKAGIRAATHPVVVVMDADGTYPASSIPLLADACQTADMVVGARKGAGLQAGSHGAP